MPECCCWYLQLLGTGNGIAEVPAADAREAEKAPPGDVYDPRATSKAKVDGVQKKAGRGKTGQPLIDAGGIIEAEYTPAGNSSKQKGQRQNCVQGFEEV